MTSRRTFLKNSSKAFAALSLASFTDHWKYTVEDAVAMAQAYIVNGWVDKSIRDNESEFMRFIDLHNKNGQLCRSLGGTLCYHN
jgi:hypothetical protein